jgi:hypothetical protein
VTLQNSCDAFQHEWEEVYYGYKCRKCGTFVAFGCEPWMFGDEYDDITESDEYEED